MSVSLRKASGDDLDIVAAAKVSTGLDLEVHDPARVPGLINYLMKSRHGSPFEHVTFTFRVSAPIFVFREFQRHRIASYNEESGRYKKLEPKFYLYPEDRPMVQSGSGAHPKLTMGTPTLTKLINGETRAQCISAWRSYERQLGYGAANEVARAVLPFDIFSSMYVTMNARALMNFLSLRVDDEDALFVSKPQWEIDSVARQLEDHFKAQLPHTHAAFVKNRRVAP